MGKPRTSAAVKNRYNSKAYDRIALVVPKGKKEEIQAYAAEHGQSVNAFICDLVFREMQGYESKHDSSADE